MYKFGDRLRQLREEHDLTQEQLGKVLNVKKAAVSKYETGYTVPDSETLKKLASFFGVSTDYLLGLTDDPTPPQQTFIERTPASSDTKGNAGFKSNKQNRLDALLRFVKDERSGVMVESLIALLAIIPFVVVELLSNTRNLSEEEKKRLMAELQSVVADAKEATSAKSDSIDISDLDDEMKEDARKYVEWLRTKQKLSPNQDETSAGLEDLDKRKAEGE
ncbi:MAG: helix-turn-helix transcriptional regulator [Syntrophomonadaceae bacterium]|nr:helix-turn-helix transcriptional regulator [Syntrophomonadaceae bacterium]